MSEPQTIYEIAHGSLEYWATIHLRDAILRKPLGLRLQAEELVAEKDSHHIACYRGDRLIACLVLQPDTGGDVRMKQVAVVPDLRYQGIGRAIVEYSEVLARHLGFTRMVLHARETAVHFYEKLGYTKHGDRFVEVTIPHWEMSKSL